MKVVIINTILDSAVFFIFRVLENDRKPRAEDENVRGQGNHTVSGNHESWSGKGKYEFQAPMHLGSPIVFIEAITSLIVTF